MTVLLLLLTVLLLCWTFPPSTQRTNTVPDKFILIDPGHGGSDGGTCATDGTLEKNINLAIGTQLQDMLQLWGYPVSMTRQTDISIHDSSATTTRQIKQSDMYNRLTLYNQAKLVISIHQNHFSIPKYNGAQVFYTGKFPEAQMLASCVREEIVRQIQPDNTRELKQATDGIFLLYRTATPAILVECGFLSNPTEREQLKTADYQQKMACAIFCGYWRYLTEVKEIDAYASQG